MARFQKTKTNSAKSTCWLAQQDPNFFETDDEQQRFCELNDRTFCMLFCVATRFDLI